jgi:hypothetical protein
LHSLLQGQFVLVANAELVKVVANAELVKVVANAELVKVVANAVDDDADAAVTVAELVVASRLSFSAVVVNLVTVVNFAFLYIL